MAGRLALEISSGLTDHSAVWGLHRGLEQLVERVDPLHQLERNRDEEELLQLDDDGIAR